MLHRLFLPALLILAACSPDRQADGREAVETEIAEGENAVRIAPTPNSIEAETNGTHLSAASAEERWLGRFAATAELCRGGVWDIGETRIITDGETACDIDRVARAAGQVTLRLACTAEGMKSREEWILTPQGEDRLKVRRDNGREAVEVDLIRCG